MTKAGERILNSVKQARNMAEKENLKIQDEKRREQFLAARLKTKRRVASVLVAALVESGVSMEEMDKRMEKPRGWTMRYINSLISGKTKELNVLSDLATSVGEEFLFGLTHIPGIENDTEE